MSALPSLSAALFQRAASDPEEPWLFRSEGWDWPWQPWGEVARRISFWAERLSNLPPGTRVAFADQPRPAIVVLDLAVQTAGLVAVPARSEEDLEGCRIWADVETDPDSGAPAGLERLRLPVWKGEGEVRLSGDRPAGSVVARREGRAVELSQADLIALADRIQAEIPPLAKPIRDVLVAGRSLADFEDRAVLAWATVTGAAVLLPSSPESRVATASWARVTVFHGTEAEVAALRAALETGSGRRFSRLRAILRPIAAW